MATIKDVAKRAGVSTTTVSRFLNSSGYVGKKTKEKIKKAIIELDYIPNEAARVLNMKASKIIGLLIPDIVNPYFSLLSKGVEDYCRDNGYLMLLGNSDGDKERTDKYLKFFLQHNISGLLVVNDGLNQLPKNIPYISIDRRQPDDKYSMITNHYVGGEMAATEIMKTNPENILIMKGPVDVDNARKRYRGMKDVFNQYPTINVEEFTVDSYQSAKSVNTAVEMGNQLKNFDTIMATNDIYAFELMKEAKRQGLKIPEDLQIIGYDGIDFIEYTTPRLSSIKQPAYEIGYRATELVINLIEKKIDDTSINIQLDPIFVRNDTLRINKENDIN